jgi:hypothetical protein
MKVYVVFRHNPEWSSVDSIWESEEKARQRSNTIEGNSTVEEWRISK